MTARRMPTPDTHGDHIDAIASVGVAGRLHPLFLVSAALRAALSGLLMLGAVYVLGLVDVSDFAGWLVLGLTTGGMASVLLDDSLDLEGRVADQVAQAAVFEADPYGARAEAVRAFADEYIRSRGRIPYALVRIRQPDTNGPFRVYFPSRRAQCRRWCLYASLIAAQRILKLVAAGLVVVAGAQIYVLVVG